jgi:large conductance mechanosensitive channel protein
VTCPFCLAHWVVALAPEPTRLVAALLSAEVLSNFVLGEGVIYGRFLTALVNFLIIAATLFFIIRVFENMQRRREVDAEPDVLKTDEVVLLGEIRDILRERV